MKTYHFPACGCTIPIDETLPDIHGHPSLIYESESTLLPLKCSTTWDMLGSGSTKGVFQLESPLGRQWTKKLKPDNIEHLGALGALLRPGAIKVKDEDGISITEHYCRRKNGEEEVTYFHPSLEPILNKTYGCLTYQEQSMAIAVALAGFSPMEADDLRKCVTDDTRFVSKKRGWITIKTLLETGYQDDEFLVMNRQGKQEWKRIEKIWSTGKHDVNKVESDSGFGVWATRYHQFDTSNGWKSRSRLQQGDSLITCRSITYDGIDVISSDMALVVAGIVCEGYFVEEQSTFVNHDISMMERFLEAYEAVFKKRPSLGQNNRVASIAKAERNKLAEFINYGLSDSRRLPEVMMGMSQETTARFLSYILACEGGVSETGQFEFSSKSYDFAWQVKLLLLRFGVKSLLLSYPESHRYRLYINDQEDQRCLYQNLTKEWSNYKRLQLNKVIEEKKTANFTTDTFPSHLVVEMIDQYPYISNGEGGSIYSQPISRKRFYRLAEKTKDPRWIELATGNQYYDPVSNLSKKRRQVETYDFTVDGDTPFIVANGVVIHNSIGKKKADLMAKVKGQFVTKAGKFGVVTTEQAEEIFSWIEKSAKYQFNKSHAISYAFVGYHTAHAKAHFPIQFFTSYLYFAKKKQDPLLEIRQLVNDAKTCGIEVLPPRMQDLKNSFNTDGIVITFGLSDVKGIGNGHVLKMRENAKIVEERIGIPKTKWSWLDFLIYFSPACPSNVVRRMIEVGGMRDYPFDRQRMLAEYDAYNQLTEKEQHVISTLKNKEYDDDGFLIKDSIEITNIVEGVEALMDFKKGIANKNRREKVGTILKMLKNPPRPLVDTADWISKTEKECLGIAITCSQVDGNPNVKADTTCQEYREGKDSGNMVMAVEIQECREIRIQNGDNRGKTMAFLVLTDGSGSLEDVCMFSEAWDKYGNIIYQGSTVEIRGRRDPKRGSFIVEEVWKV